MNTLINYFTYFKETTIAMYRVSLSSIKLMYMHSGPIGFTILCIGAAFLIYIFQKYINRVYREDIERDVEEKKLDSWRHDKGNVGVHKSVSIAMRVISFVTGYLTASIICHNKMITQPISNDFQLIGCIVSGMLDEILLAIAFILIEGFIMPYVKKKIIGIKDDINLE